jgi:hypothetical protein
LADYAFRSIRAAGYFGGERPEADLDAGKAVDIWARVIRRVDGR